MKSINFFEKILDNVIDCVYVLDDEGNYIFVNSAYVKMLNMPKDVLLKYNVHDFLKTGQIDLCVSDIVYKEKKQIIMFQDVVDTQNFGRPKKYRQLIISTPLFDTKKNIKNIVAVVRPIQQMEDLYLKASSSRFLSTVSKQQNNEDNSIIANSKLMKNIIHIANSVSKSDSSILVSGETGCGKNVFVEYIHKLSSRNNKKLVTINCSSVAENLLEAELFGYEKGSFTGALKSGKEGLIESADGGTLFLDEINSMPLNLQSKVLHALETKTIRRVGSTMNRKIDFRLISATNESLEKLIEEKKFRSDLYYRISVIPIFIPPLRERKEDIIPLAIHFLNIYSKMYGKDVFFTENSLTNLENYSWPGNVRELRNVVERAVVMATETTIHIDNLEELEQKESEIYLNKTFKSYTNKVYDNLINDQISLQEYIENEEKKYIEYVLNKYNSTYKVAEILNTSQSTIMRKKKKYNI